MESMQQGNSLQISGTLSLPPLSRKGGGVSKAKNA